MDLSQAFDCVTKSLTIDVGRFYAPGTSLGLGKGSIFGSVPYPIFDDDRRLFVTAEGLVYVLTHECDIEDENERLFNTDLLICPIIPLQYLVEAHLAELPQTQLVSFLTNLGARRISRLIYLPPCPPDLAYGGIMYLNHIANTSVDVFRDGAARLIGAVTGYGLTIIEQILENHLLRPKADRLAFVPEHINL